jgi:hypothetical protein
VHVTVVNRHPSVALGGSETQCALIAEGLVRLGHAVTWIAPGGAVEAVRPYAVVGVEDFDGGRVIQRWRDGLTGPARDDRTCPNQTVYDVAATYRLWLAPTTGS